MKREADTIGDLLKKTKQKKVICFGRGAYFREFKILMASYNADDRIIGIIDNDSTIQGTIIPGFSVSYVTYDISFLIKHAKDCVVVITVKRGETTNQILAQLAKIRELKDVLVFHCAPMIDEWKEKHKKELNIPSSFRVTDKPIIPKTIHYCWFGRQPIPLKNKEWISTWRKYCPDYEIVEWNEDNYDISKNQYMKEAYEAKAWGFVSDYARLDIVYENGGIYLDTDVELVKSLDDFLYENGFAGYSEDELVSLGLGFGAKKRLPVLKELLDIYNTLSFSALHSPRDVYAVLIAPDIHTKYLREKYKNYYTGTVVDMDGLRVYPSPILDGKGNTNRNLQEYVYTIHHYDGSWAPKE